MEPILLSVVERCLLYGGVIFFNAVFWGKNICLLFRDVHCIEVSVSKGPTKE